MKISIGTDPEFFILNNKEEPVSAIPFIKGTKIKPIKTKHGNIIHDNVLVEINPKPSVTVKGFMSNFKNLLSETIKYLPQKHSLTTIPAFYMPAKELEHPKAKEFGCDPDADAWNKCYNSFPAEAVHQPLRTAGGHIHIGIKQTLFADTFYSFEGKLNIVKTMDILAGILSIILEKNEMSRIRRTLYGAAGAHRTKYMDEGSLYEGVEYRSLSSFWLSDQILCELFARITEDAVIASSNQSILDIHKECLDEGIVNIINNSDEEKAQAMFNKVYSDFKLYSSKTMRILDTIFKHNYNTNLIENWGL